MTTILLMLTVLWLAYSNGANDNFKGVATLYGSSTTRFEPALWWATVATAAGSLVSVMAASKLVVVFSGKGLLPQALLGSPELLIAVGLGSAVTIFLATLLGMPTSTTHALTGALFGINVAAASSIPIAAFLHSFAGPLLLSPVIAIVLAATIYLVLRKLGKALRLTRMTCVCLSTEAPLAVTLQTDGSAALAPPAPQLSVGRREECAQRFQRQFVSVDAEKSLNTLHYVSAGTVCFSRAVNDTPKIAALLFATQTWNSSLVLGLVATAMVLGGLLNSRRVAVTMSKRITDLDPGQGLSANFVTAALVLFASQFGLPVSTTHVSCGSIFGVGLVNRSFQWKTILEISAAWVTTLPLAALLGGLIFWLIRGVQ